MILFLKMDNLPHVKLDTKKQSDPPITLKFNYGFGKEEEDEEDDVKNYQPMAASFRVFLDRLIEEQDIRVKGRTLNVRQHIDYVNIQFYSQFVVTDFYDQWFNEFGLLGIYFAKFNTVVLFAIADRDRFGVFLKEVENFIKAESGESTGLAYSRKLLYVRQFQLLTSAGMMHYNQTESLMNFRLVDDYPIGANAFRPIYEALEEYLNINGLPFSYNSDSHNLEVGGITPQHIGAKFKKAYNKLSVFQFAILMP